MEGNSLSVKKRNPSFELLRVIAMLMILTLHYNIHAEVLLQLGIPAAAVNLFANIMEAFAITGLNVYVLISGYFLSKGKVKLSRIITLICQVYFYTLIISLVMQAVGASSGVRYAHGTVNKDFRLHIERLGPLNDLQIFFGQFPCQNNS